MDQSLSRKLRAHAAGFTPEAFEKLITDIALSQTLHRDVAEDEDELFELILEDVLPQDADQELEGRIMLLLDHYFDLQD